MATNSEYIALADEAAAELLRREENAAEVAAGPLADYLQRAETLLGDTWPGDDAPLGQRIEAALVLSLSTDQADVALIDAQSQLLRIVNNVSALGATTAVLMAALGQAHIQPEVVTGSSQTVIGTSIAKYARRVETARRMISRANTKAAAEQGIDKIRKLIPRVDGLSRWVVANAYHSSLARTAQQDPELTLIWRAERDACLNCLAYAGQVVKPGHSYPPGLTFGDRPLPPPSGGKVTPPLHPRCRCEQIVWRRVSSPTTTLPQALRREAERSVLRGWGDASGPARGRAAKRLLESGVTAPQSVLNAARRIALKYDNA